MFQSVLKDVVDSAGGGVASLVMDLDGITLDSYSKPDAAFDINNIGIELSVVVKQVIQAGTMLEAGQTKELAIVADGLTTLVRMITEQYFIALSLEPSANLGKARYVLRTRAPLMVADLS